MYEKYKENKDYINTSSIVLQQLFMVELIKNDNSIQLKPIEIEYFHEEPNKKVVLKVRYHSKNLLAIDQISKLKRKYLPNCLVCNKDKFKIALTLLTPSLKENYKFTYENCVLKKVTYPMYFYGKGSDNIATAYFEFKYSDKKSSANDIDINTTLTYKKFPKYYWDYRYEGEVEYDEKTDKILENSNKMLDEALKTTEKYYKNFPDKEKDYETVKSCINKAKEENKYKQAKLKNKKKNGIKFLNAEIEC